MEPERSAVMLGERLGHVFVDLLLLERALTHRSWVHEHAPAIDNESLAFLGDAVLALVVAEHLWRGAPGESVGVLTPGRAEVVSGANLARWAEGRYLVPAEAVPKSEDEQDE